MNSPNVISKEEFFNKAKHLLSNKEKVSIFIIDIDNSKQLFGDEIDHFVIDEIFKFLTSKIPNITVSQVGRDAFSGLIVDDKRISLLEIASIKEELQHYLEKKTNIKITFCMGISTFPDFCKDVENVFSTAFEALLVAKTRGSNSMESAFEESMKLKSLYFRKKQLIKLAKFSKQTNKSESYIIRRALDDFFEKNNL